MTSRAVRFGLVCLLSLAGCKRLATGAKEHFAKEYSCPEGRVEVIPRSDLKYSAYFPPRAAETPPDEVKRDPERLARWRADREGAHKAQMADLDGRLDMFQARGCDHEVFMGCAHASAGDGVDTSSVVCFIPPLGKKK
jgi:hypothetical protein